MSQQRTSNRMDARVVNPIMRIVSSIHVSLYRLSRGRLGAQLAGAPVLLLATKGRRTGKLRITPLIYLQDGDNVVIVASKGGASKDPVWWLNLKANPQTNIQVRDKLVRVQAHQADAVERARLWPRLVDLYSDYENYQRSTDREIPVVVLEPV